jgi:hypothetical protein
MERNSGLAPEAGSSLRPEKIEFDWPDFLTTEKHVGFN